jgi:hypothetical protein
MAPLAGLARILFAKDSAEPDEMTYTSGLGAYSFKTVFAEHTFKKANDDPKRIGTIESRQHCWSLDGEELTNGFVFERGL